MKKITGWMMVLAAGAALALPAMACEQVTYGPAYGTYGTVVRPDVRGRQDVRRDVRQEARQSVRNEAPARVNYNRR